MTKDIQFIMYWSACVCDVSGELLCILCLSDNSCRFQLLYSSIKELGVVCHICSCVSVLAIGVSWLHSIVHSACYWYMSSSRPGRRHYVWFCCLVLLCETWVVICCPMCVKDDIGGHPSMTITLLSCLLFTAGRRHCHSFFHDYFLVQLFIVCGRIYSKTVHVSYDYFVFNRRSIVFA